MTVKYGPFTVAFAALAGAAMPSEAPRPAANAKARMVRRNRMMPLKDASGSAGLQAENGVELGVHLQPAGDRAAGADEVAVPVPAYGVRDVHEPPDGVAVAVADVVVVPVPARQRVFLHLPAEAAGCRGDGGGRGFGGRAGGRGGRRPAGQHHRAED